MLLVVADPDKPGEGLVALDKANAGTLAVPALRYRLRSAPYIVAESDPETGEVTEHSATVAVADWVGVEPGDGRAAARDLLVPAMSRDDDPAGWLRGYLTDAGETLRQTIVKAGREAGFGDKQLQRAAQRLRVLYRDATEDRPGTTPLRRVTWRLPDDGQDTSRAKAPTTVPTVPTAAPKSLSVSSPSQVRSGEDGGDGHDRVRESVLTAVLTESSDHRSTDSDAPGRPPASRTGHEDGLDRAEQVVAAVLGGTVIDPEPT